MGCNSLVGVAKYSVLHHDTQCHSVVQYSLVFYIMVNYDTTLPLVLIISIQTLPYQTMTNISMWLFLRTRTDYGLRTRLHCQ